MNKFEQVSSDHHQMSLAGWRQDQGGPRSDVGGGGREILGLISGGGGAGGVWLYSEIQCMMGNAPMDPTLWTE